MRSGSDFHVVSLTYRLIHGETVTYDAPPPVEFATDEASFRLADAKLTCGMNVHYSTVAQARAVTEPVLRAWELDTNLRLGKGNLHFQFESGDIIDRAPVPPGTIRGSVASAVGRSVATAVGSISAHVTRRTYPAAPGEFRITPDVETLWYRFGGYRDGKEPLQSMAYFCLTVLEASAGRSQRDRRRKAAAMYKIDEIVLKKLGELTSDRGDPSTARKMATSAMRPLSGKEAAWIEELVKQLIWRLGDQRGLPQLPTIGMADLPSL